MRERAPKVLRGPVPRNKEDDQVVYIDGDSAPRILFSGEDLLLEDLPIGTRVIYPKPPIEGLANPGAAIRYALNHPLEADPLYAQLAPGMRVTIAVDDISVPLPPMATPDIRQTMLEILLEMLDANGVDDVHIIVATCLHRKMTEAEMRRMVGSKIHDAFYPDRYYCNDVEDPDGFVHLGTTEHKEVVNIHRRAVESDLVIYVNINFVPMDGGHKSVTIGLGDYEVTRPHHEPSTMRSSGYMDPKHSMLNTKIERQGAIVQQHMNVFHIETVLNNRMFSGPTAFLSKNEDEFTEIDRLKFEAMRWSLGKLPAGAKRKLFQAIPSQYQLIAVHAGKTEPVHAKTLARCFEQYAVHVRGQADILICGVPFISPYNVNSILNPILVQTMGLGYFHNMFRGKPVLKKGGVMILTHPVYDEFDHVQHPSYIEFFNRILTETTDAYTIEQKYQDELAYNPSYIEMYRRGNAYHGAHPCFMWYWGQRGREKTSRVIVVGADNATVPAIMGWETAGSIAEAIAMARSTMGRSAQITMLHHPPYMISDVM
jgi:lactate racemase